MITTLSASSVSLHDSLILDYYPFLLGVMFGLSEGDGWAGSEILSLPRAIYSRLLSIIP
jgi:hypothetical protein